MHEDVLIYVFVVDKKLIYPAGRDAKAIYLRDFWQRGAMEQYDPAVAFQVFDAAVNHGIETALRMLQRSRIACIGKTEFGIRRLTSSAAERAEHILDTRGVYSFESRVIHYPSDSIDRRLVWKKEPPILLERALLLRFAEMFGRVRLCNGTGHRMKPLYGEYAKFSHSRLKSVLEELS